MNKIEKTKTYLMQIFNDSEYLKDRPYEKAYRLDHTLRVGHWGKYIAENEGLDVEALVVGCLLHDASYIEEMPTDEIRYNHGRRSAEIVRPFVETLGFDFDTTNDILYGIAIHVDNESNFDWHRSVLAESISDADNIDRFDVYRIYESLEYEKFSQITNDEKIAYCEKRIARAQKNLEINFATDTATKAFHEELHTMKTFFERMLAQCRRTV